jgi:hypothetical protein
MKKLFTLWVLVAAFSLGVVAQKKVAYFTRDKVFGTSDITDQTKCMVSTATVDAVLTMLQADANFTVTVYKLNVADYAASVDFSAFDLVVVQESFGSGDAILKPAGVLALKTVPKPMIYNKSYALRKNLALDGTSPGAAAEGGNEISVAAGSETNPLFTAIPLTDNKFVPFVTTTTDLGAAGTKATNYTTANVVSGSSTLLASPTGVTTAAFCINDVPAGTTIDSETTLARIIFIGQNYGAICATEGTNMTSANLTLWRNAAYILTGLTVPTTPVTTALPRIKTDSGSVLAIAGGIKVSTNAPSKVSVYSVDGKVIASKTISGTETIACQKGIYMVRINGSAVKVMVAK